MAESKIFVIDDDAVARDLLTDALAKEGYDVEAFEGGAQAIQRGKETKVDLVLTDIRMGTVDGLAVLREFKRFSPDTSIVLLTAFGSLEGAIEGIKQRGNTDLGDKTLLDSLVPAVDEGLDKAGRDHGEIDRMIEVKVSWDPDPERALENCRFWAPLSLSAEQKHSIHSPEEMERAADELPIEQVA